MGQGHSSLPERYTHTIRASFKGGAGGAPPLDKLLPPLNFKQKFKLKSQIQQQQL